MKKQFIAKLLALALVLSMVPAGVMAASASAATAPGGEQSQNNGYYVVYEDTSVRVSEPVAADGVIEAKVVAGTAIVTLNSTAVESLADLAQGGEIALEIKSEGATKVEVNLAAQALIGVAEETGADLTIKSSVATITIPNEVLVNEFTGIGSVKVSVQATGSSVGFSIQASGKALKNIKGLTVEF